MADPTTINDCIDTYNEDYDASVITRDACMNACTGTPQQIQTCKVNCVRQWINDVQQLLENLHECVSG